MKYLGLETQVTHKSNGEMYIKTIEVYEVNIDDEVVDPEIPRTTTAEIPNQAQYAELIDKCKYSTDRAENKHVDPRIIDNLRKSIK